MNPLLAYSPLSIDFGCPPFWVKKSTFYACFPLKQISMVYKKLGRSGIPNCIVNNWDSDEDKLGQWNRSNLDSEVKIRFQLNDDVHLLLKSPISSFFRLKSTNFDLFSIKFTSFNHFKRWKVNFHGIKIKNMLILSKPMQ